MIIIDPPYFSTEEHFRWTKWLIGLWRRFLMPLLLVPLVFSIELIIYLTLSLYNKCFKYEQHATMEKTLNNQADFDSKV